MDYNLLCTKPIKLLSNRVWRTYSGGRMIEQWNGTEGAADSEFPEEWVASTVKAKNVGREHIEEGYSLFRLEDGTTATLKEAIELAPVAFLGEDHYRKYGSETGVLVKVLDAAERLTIQVHPDKPSAKRLFNSAFGKTEAWFVLGGRTINGMEPQLLLGFKPGMTREKWQNLFQTQHIAGMIDSLHAFPLEPESIYLVEGGVPHAIGSGCFLVEIQEPTDLTLRVERTTPHGNVVPDAACHQGVGFDRMLDCFQYEALTYEQAHQRWKLAPTIIRLELGGTETELIGVEATSCFRMNRLVVKDRLETASSRTFYSAIIVAGEGKLLWPDGELAVSQSDQLFIPASCPSLLWVANDSSQPLQALLCYPPM
jgi:mannose-6-phosphate isomerase